MDYASWVVVNGFIPLLPILLFNILLAKKLPPPFSTDQFDEGVGRGLLWLENSTRLLVFLMPLLVSLDLTTPSQKQGCGLYLFGCLLYFGSWLLLISRPQAARNVVLFSAPAWTPAIWLLGLSLMMEDFWGNSIPFQPISFQLVAFVFLAAHLAHTLIAYQNTDSLS